MSETLLGLSEVLIFGREVEDLMIRGPANADHSVKVATTRHQANLDTNPVIDGIQVGDGDLVLVRHQNNANIDQEDIYEVKQVNTAWVRTVVATGETVFVQEGKKSHDKVFIRREPRGNQHRFKPAGGRRGLGRNKQLDQQLEEDARFARIYGFSYEGTYFELPSPTLFLVQGEGESATDNLPDDHASRAPFNPSRSGVAAADFQFADDIMVWAYDKADYTIRMDVATGMFEQVLLDAYFGGGGPAVSGAKVSGAKVSGAKVSGAKVSGAKVSGAKARGPGD
jgi:hypothetical protein